MTVHEKQLQLISRYAVLPTPQERLDAFIDQSAQSVPLVAEEKTEGNRVHGCQSRVYVLGRIEEGVCRFRSDSDSVLVRGLVSLVCNLYDGGTPEEVIQVEPEILSKLGVWQIISPTRQNGLTHVRRFIKEWAEGTLQLRITN